MVNKLTKKEYVQLIATGLNEEYGDTLVEDNTDIKMAEQVVKKLTDYLYFRKESKESRKAYSQWKKDRIK
jgi:hypothetical protein